VQNVILRRDVMEGRTALACLLHPAVPDSTVDLYGTTSIVPVAPSLGILGGQAVQTIDSLRKARRPDVAAFLVPINPAPPRPLRFATRVKYLRTVVAELTYAAARSRAGACRRARVFGVLLIVPAGAVGRSSRGCLTSCRDQSSRGQAPITCADRRSRGRRWRRRTQRRAVELPISS
jgi:hypothetical protein